MTICRVIGAVVVSKDASGLDGPTYLLVEPATAEGGPAGSAIIAADAVQAGEGDLVLLSQGSSCRQIQAPESPATADKAVDALIIGVIDLVESDGRLTYDGGMAKGLRAAEDNG